MSAQTAIVLARHPQGVPHLDDFRFEQRNVPDAGDGEVLVEVRYLSMDPFLRLQLAPSASMGRPVRPGDVIPGRALGRVRTSRDPSLKTGDWVIGDLGWQRFSVMAAQSLSRIDVDDGLGPSVYLGALGSPGLTAALLLEATQAAAGDTVVISAAAGAVGNVAAQLARLRGCRVIGLSGSQARRDYLLSVLGLDAVHDHRDPAALSATLVERGGVDVFLDSIGGALHDAVLSSMNPLGRIVMYGFISGYNSSGKPASYGSMMEVLRKRLTVSGFLVGDHASLFPSALKQLHELVRSGRLTVVENIHQGLGATPQAFASLFDAAPPGKTLVCLGDDPL